eukprot:2530603-Amphidinium_carterae.1
MPKTVRANKACHLLGSLLDIEHLKTQTGRIPLIMGLLKRSVAVTTITIHLQPLLYHEAVTTQRIVATHLEP